MSTDPDIIDIADAHLQLSSLPLSGKHLKIAVEKDCLLKITERMKVSAVEMMSVELDVKKFRGGIEVRGLLRARVTQQSVVSLLPVTQLIEEGVQRVFLPAERRQSDDANSREIVVEPQGDDVPDFFSGRTINLTEMLLETLALGIDPYPRAPGEVPTVDSAPEVATVSPFEMLKSLKSKGD